MAAAGDEDAAGEAVDAAAEAERVVVELPRRRNAVCFAIWWRPGLQTRRVARQT